MPATIIVNPNTFDLEVRHDLQTPVFPTALTIEIEKLAAAVKFQMNAFIEQKHNPLVGELLKKVDEFNLANNPELAAKRKAEEEKKVLAEQAATVPVLVMEPVTDKVTKKAPTKKGTRQSHRKK